jgi:glycosyltransferase involved in cell wall biosynthesis
MKTNCVALTTEWNGKHGGAENVNIEICKLFLNNPDVYSIWNENSEISFKHQSFLRFLKVLPKQITGILSLFYHLIGLPQKYYLVISSSFMFSHLSRPRNRNGKHLVYVHTPIRYIWSPEIDGRGTDWKFIFKFVNPIVKKIELYFLDRNAVFVCNSQEVKKRIIRDWGLEPIVINPPVDVDFYQNYFQTNRPISNQLISAGRFVKYKNLDLAIGIAKRLDCKLILAGAGPEEENLRALASNLGVNVEFVISPTREKLANLIAVSSIYLHLAHEDFGILPIEAMATGTPVVGFDVGGLRETVNALNGRLSLDFDSLSYSVTEALMLDRSKVAATVEKYSSSRFRSEMIEVITSKWPELNTLIEFNES